MTASDENERDLFDVVVIGAGVAGMCAAIAACDAGARTLLLEASDRVGGTASWSGGAAWIPLNRRMAEAGFADSRDAALRYMRVCAEGRADEALYGRFVEVAAGVADYLETSTPLELEMGTMPDYQGGIPGGFYVKDASRSMAPAVFDIHRLGDKQSLFRRSPYGTVPLSFREFANFDAILHPERIDAQLYGERMRQGYLGWGEALAAALYAGVLERAIDVRVNARALRLLANGRVRGVVASMGGHEREFAARRGVILCSGGFEWDPELVAQQFNGVKWIPSTVPTNMGDGWRMAEQAGAAMGNHGTCWGWPSYLVPGETREDGLPLVRSSLVERCLPHCIVVDRHGRRFVDESLPYHRINKVLIERDAQGFRHLPAWHLFDQQFRDKYAFGPIMPAQPTPEWLGRYESLDALARRLGIPPNVLQQTIDRFNADVRAGRDTEFGRGEAPYGVFWGDPDNPTGPCLGTLEKPPFYAVEMLPSTIGTCAGPRIDGDGRVVRADGRPVPGLFAAGNATSAVSGPSYFGPGGTIGPAMVFGVLAGRAAAGAEP
ncbi:MAG: FAD-dependent oxidoreductase [Gammaproteobacteria bacterium]|nr:FAD-dependent oxidoreductase [Gammaproteobacteria bacterium]